MTDSSQFMFQTLHATSQDGSSLESVAATAGRECNIQDAKKITLLLILFIMLILPILSWMYLLPTYTVLLYELS